MKRTFDEIEKNEKNSQSSQAQTPKSPSKRPKKGRDKLKLFKPNEFSSLLSERQGQYRIVTKGKRPSMLEDYCVSLTKILYTLGAVLINKGYAYTDTKLTLISEDIFLTNFFDLSVVGNLSQAGKLLQLYDEIESYSDDDKRGVSNPLQALFVLKVALEHLPMTFIKLLYEEIKPYEMEMSFRGTGITLPNGEKFQTEFAIYWILPAYIMSNLSEFHIKDPDVVASLMKVTDGYELYLYPKTDKLSKPGNMFHRKILDELNTQTFATDYQPKDFDDSYLEETPEEALARIGWLNKINDHAKFFNSQSSSNGQSLNRQPSSSAPPENTPPTQPY